MYRFLCNELKDKLSTTTTTTTILQPFVRDYPGELVPEETFPCHILVLWCRGR